MSIRAAWRVLWHGEEKESATGPLVAARAAGRPVSPMERFDQIADEAYVKNVVAYRCIEEICKGVASVPLLLFAGEDEVRQNHEVLQRLKRPNPMQSWPLWISYAMGYFLIAGNSYLEIVAPTGGSPRELYALRPDRMRVVPGARGFPEAYIYKLGTGEQRFEVDPLKGRSDIRHLKTFHPLDDWYGMSPIQAAATGINQFNAAGVWNQNLLLQGASRGAVLEMQAQDGRFVILSDEQYKVLDKRLTEQYAGPQKAGRPKLVEGGLKWVDASFSPQDMDFINSKHTSARDICSAFGFPCQLLGIPGDNTYSNYKEARQALFENTVMPLTNMLLAELNAWYVPQFAEGLELKPDEDQVLALAPRRESLWERVNGASHLSPNEKRAATGYEPHEPTGDPADDLYQPATMVPLSMDIGEEDESELPPKPGEGEEEAEEEFEKRLLAMDVPPAMVAEMKKKMFGNGRWRDSA